MPYQDSAMMKGPERDKPMDPFISRMRQAPSPAASTGQAAPSGQPSHPFAKMGGMGARAAMAQRQQPQGQGQPLGQPPAQAPAYGLRERLSQAPRAMAGRDSMGGGWNPNAPSPDMQRRMIMNRGSRMPPPVDFGPGAPPNGMRGPEPMPPPRLAGGGFTGQGRREFPSVPPGVMEQLRSRLGSQGGGVPMAGGTGVGPYGNPFFNQISQAPGPMPPQVPPQMLPGPQGPIATAQPVMPPENFYY